MRRSDSEFSCLSAHLLYTTPKTAPMGITRVKLIGRYMPMPTASGGRNRFPPVVFRRISSTMMTPTPISAPRPKMFQSNELPKIPFATDDNNAACGAASASGPAPAMPSNPKACSITCNTGGITIDPNTTPIINATCCRHGVASTNWPVFRSCKLSFEIVAIPNTTAAVNSVYATKAGAFVSCSFPVTTLMSSAEANTTMMPTPEIGEFEAPINPAM